MPRCCSACWRPGRIPDALARKQQSDLIVELAPHVEDFIGELFGISADLRALQAKHHSLAPIYALKRRFVQKKAISGVTKEQASAINGLAVAAELEALFNEPLTEASFVEHVSRWLDAEQEHRAAAPDRRAVRRVGRALPGGDRKTSSRRAVPRSPQAGDDASDPGGDACKPTESRRWRFPSTTGGIAKDSSSPMPG